MSLPGPTERALDAWRSSSVSPFVVGSVVVGAGLSPALRALTARVCAQQKARDALWRGCAHALTAALGCAICAGRPWTRDPSLAWADWPPARGDMQGLVALYAVFCGFALGSLPDLRRANEFYTMVAHHALTLALVAFSFRYGFLRIGAVAMLSNDAVDVWFEAAKLLRYAGKERASYACLCCFVLAWGAVRQAVAPAALWRLFWKGCAEVQGRDDWGTPAWRNGILAAFGIMLAALWAMHTYWFAFLVAKVANYSCAPPPPPSRKHERRGTKSD